MQAFFATIPSWVFWVVGVVYGLSTIVMIVCMRNAEPMPPIPEERDRS